jgi:hypothetical protein
MSLSEKTQQHPVVAGTVCFVFLATALIGGITAYQRVTQRRAGQEAALIVSATSNQVQRLDRALEQARELLRQSSTALSADERIKVNQAIVIVDENRPIYGMVLSNACASLQARKYEFFRSALDAAQQSNLLHALQRDRQSLELVIRYCKDRTKSVRPPGSR